MEKPLLLLALVPLAVGLVLIYVVIGSKNREDQKDSFACLLSAHGRCRRVGHRETTRMTLHAAACCPGYCPRPFPALRAIPAITSLPRSQAHETLGAMTTIIMRTSHDNPSQLFFALFQGFRFWETCRLRSFSTRHLQAPKNNLILLCISAAYRCTRKKHASVPATYLRWRSRSIRSTSVCSSCSTQSRKMEQNESGLPSTCHASRPRAYDRPASYLMATGRYPFRSSTKLSSWRPVRPLPSCNTTLGLTKKSIIDFHFLSTFFAGSLCLIHIIYCQSVQPA